MKWLLGAILLAAAAWSGMWYFGAETRRDGLRDWFEARRDEGWQADYGDLALRGFPNRYDATITDIALADPERGLVFTAPFLQILTLAYNSDHAILVWPEEFRIATPRRGFDIAARPARASVVLNEAEGRGLQRANLDAEALRITGDDGRVVTAERLRVALELSAAAAARYHLGIAAEGLGFPGRLAAPETGTGALELDAEAGFARAVTVSDAAPPRLEDLHIRRAEMRWGAASVAVAGRLAVERDGRARGKLTLRLVDWRAGLEAARQAGLLSAAVAEATGAALTLLAELKGGADKIDVPLEFRGGRVWIGLLPVGDAPRLAAPLP